MAHLPQGTLVAITGGKDRANPAAVIERLDKARGDTPTSSSCMPAAPASRRSRQAGPSATASPSAAGSGLGPLRTGAPFRRNDDLLAAAEGDRIPRRGANLVDKARQLHAVQRIAGHRERIAGRCHSGGAVLLQTAVATSPPAVRKRCGVPT